MAKKSTRRRQTTTKSSRTEQKQGLPLAALLTIIVLGLILVGAAGVLLYRNAHKETADTATPEVLATVNAQPITSKALEFQYNLLPEQYRSQFSRQDVLEQIITEELVVQAAQKNGVEVSQEDVQARVQSVLASSGLSISDLQENLDHFNVTVDQFEYLVKRQLMIERYLKTVINVTNATDAQLQELYDASRDQYTVDEQVTVRHVLISNQRADAALLAKDVYDRAKGGEDFCELVANYTDDKGSRDTCGEYTFPRNFMVPEFENASFAMAPGEFRLVQTQFGYHIIEKINSTPAGVQPFSAVRETLAQQYRDAEYARQYGLLTSELRDAALITYAPGYGSVEAKVTPETTVAPTQEVVAEQEPVVEPDTYEPALTPAPETTDFDQEAILRCIAPNTVLYGVEWSTDTREARTLFASQGITLPYVACDENPQTCKELGIQAYPSWKIKGALYTGRLTLDELKQASEC